MKNAMKKLMSLLLVAVLLVSALPFAASAANAEAHVIYEYEADGVTPKSWVICPVNPETNHINEEYRNQVAAAIAGHDIIAWVFSVNGQQYSSVMDIDFTNLTGAHNVYPVFKPAAPQTITIYVDGQNSAGIKAYTVTVNEALGETVLPSDPNPGKTGHVFNGWYLNGTDKITSANKAQASWNGATIYASWTQVGCIECGQTSGHAAGCTKGTPIVPDNGTTGGSNDVTNNAPASSMYVDVIITPNKTSGFTSSDYYRCNLVDGKITAADRNTVAALIAGKNIGAWKRADNGTQAYTLLDFDFSGLKQPINILPVLKTTTTTPTTPSTPSTGNNNNVSNSGVYNKFPYNVYLNIYKDTMVGSPDKCIDITSGIALDGLVSLSEVKTVVANYYNAKNSYGIGFDGLYLASGNWVANYVADTQKYNEIAAGQMRQTGYVYINVMISNATAKVAYTADSSNPKTGDSIYTAMTVMGISAASLAAVMYFYNKKRMAL